MLSSAVEFVLFKTEDMKSEVYFYFIYDFFNSIPYMQIDWGEWIDPWWGLCLFCASYVNESTYILDKCNRLHDSRFNIPVLSKKDS